MKKEGKYWECDDCFDVKKAINKSDCEHCICYCGGPTYRTSGGKFGKCCWCGAENKDNLEKEKKERDMEEILIYGERFKKSGY